jgi:hypothetical protein
LLYGILEISIDLFGCQCAGGDERIRTADPLLAKQVLSQLSYIPWGTRCVLLATLHERLPPRAELDSAGGSSDLESLKSGKDRTKLRCALKKRNEPSDFHRALSRLPRTEMRDLPFSGRLLFDRKQIRS